MSLSVKKDKAALAESENFLQNREKPLIFSLGNANVIVAKTMARQRAPGRCRFPKTTFFKEVAFHV